MGYVPGSSVEKAQRGFRNMLQLFVAHVPPNELPRSNSLLRNALQHKLHLVCYAETDGGKFKR